MDEPVRQGVLPELRCERSPTFVKGDPCRAAHGRAGHGVTGRLPCTFASEAVRVSFAPLASLALPSNTLLRSESLGDAIRVQVVDTALDEAPVSSMDVTVAESVNGGVVEVRAAAAALPSVSHRCGEARHVGICCFCPYGSNCTVVQGISSNS